MRKLLAHFGLAIPAIAGLVVGILLVATPAQAAKHPTVQSQIQHYLECLNLMLKDPTKHRNECGPGHEFFFPANNNFSPGSTVGLPVVTSSPPPSSCEGDSCDVPPPCEKPPCEKPPCEKPPCEKPPCEKPPCEESTPQ